MAISYTSGTCGIVLHNKYIMKFAITITASKLMAFVIILIAFVIDLTGKGATAFMFAVPFVASLVLGKQYFDSKNGNSQNTVISDNQQK